MKRILSVTAESFPISGVFTISRGSKTEADVLTCTVREGEHLGRGECVPYSRYGETLEGVQAAIEAMGRRVSDGLGRAALLAEMQPGAARNAIDSALWDLEAKLSGVSVASRLAPQPPAALETAFTLSLGTPEAMAASAAAEAHRPLLKIKLGGFGDLDRMRAVAEAAPRSRIIVDANEGWSGDDLFDNLAAAAELGVVLVEQPLPAGRDAALRDLTHPVPICADESFHTADDLPRLVGLYDAVNIKLDKSGGLTAALAARDRAKALGFQVMVGCMVGTSLAMAPAVLLAQGAAFVDLDGPLLLAKDRERGLKYHGSMVSPPEAGLWG